MVYEKLKSYSFNPFAKRFWLPSAVLHGLALLAAFLFGSYAVSQEKVRTNTVKVAQSIDRTERVQKQKVEKKVTDSSQRVQQIEARMRKLSGEKDTEPAPKPEIEDPKKKLEQALEKARKSLEKIEKLEQKAKAVELARILKIPVDQALKRLPPPPPKPTESPLPLTDKQIADKIVDYEKQAKKILDGQEKKETRKNEGTQLAQNQANKKSQTRDTVDSSLDRTVKMAKNSLSSGAAQGASQSTGGVGATHADGGRGGTVTGTVMGDAGAGEGRVENRGVGEPDRVYEGTSTTQKLAKESVRGFDGRIIGAGAEFTNRVYLNAWYVIGPFAASNAAYQEALPPESGVDLDAAYFGKGRQLLQWKYHETKSYPYVPPHAEGDAVYYGYTEIMLDKDRVLIADIGSDDDAKIWVNDTLVWRGNNAQKPWYRNGGFRPLQYERETYNLTEGSIKLNLKKGRNKILFRLFNGYADVFFSMVLSPGK